MEKMARTAEISQRYLFRELDPSFMSLVLVTCFFISGLIDSVAFNSWNCFVNMQTGKKFILTSLIFHSTSDTHHR